MKTVSLGCIVEYVSRGIAPKYVEDNGLLILNQKCIRNQKIDLRPARFHDKAKKIMEQKKLKKYDILINSTGVGTLGRVAQLKEDLVATVDSHITVVRISKTLKDSLHQVDPLFVGYAIRNQESLLESLGKGATGQTELSRESILNDICVTVPEYPIQVRTSSILQRYDDLIENNEKRIKALEEMAQLLYTEWFVKFRFPGHENTEMINSGLEYGMIPEGWRVTNLNHAVLVNPSNKKGTTYSSLHFSMECLSNSLSSIDLGKSSIKNKPTGSRFINGDTLFARITPCLQNGKGGYVDFLRDDEFASGSTEFVVLRQKELGSIYIYFLSRDKSFRESAIMTMVGASGRQRVTKGFFEAYKVLVPSRALLDKFESAAIDIFGQIKILDHANRKLSRMRDLLIPQLITGKRELK